MRKFLKKLLLFFGAMAIFLIVFFAVWFQYYTAPPPNASNSISLNAKVLFLKNNFSEADIDVLSIGSSMSLNNINTEAFADTKYLNASSWGLNMKEIFNLLKIYNIKYNPKTLIISSNLNDFNISQQEIDYTNISEYLSSDNFSITDLKFWSFRQAIQDSRLLSLYKFDNTSYQSLKFDKSGGVNYPATNFHINENRWRGDDLKTYAIDPVQYSYLDSISTFCSSHSIKLIFVQSPFREGYYSKIKEEDLAIIQNHIKKVENTLVNTNTIFVNSVVENWKDSLFVDFTHLNEEGSRVYTEYFLKQVKMKELTIKN